MAVSDSIIEQLLQEVFRRANGLNAIRIDITFSKRISARDKRKKWYRSMTFYLKDEDNQNLINHYNTVYNDLLSAFKAENQIPIDSLRFKDFTKKPYFQFTPSSSRQSTQILSKPDSKWEQNNNITQDPELDAEESIIHNQDIYEWARMEIRDKIKDPKQNNATNNTDNNETMFERLEKLFSDLLFEKTGFQQIIVFPFFARSGLGTNCIIGLSQPVNDDSKLESFFYHLLRYICNESFDELSSLINKESIKSAKAAIMSRNMSHNLGSHVMSYLKVHLGSVSNILRDHVLSTLLENEDLNTFRNHALVADKLTLPFLVGIGRFISYLQERQDFIATVSTDFVPYYSSVNFKDFIYDELNGDKRYERHPDRTNLKPDNILLGNIARSEGLGRQTSPTKGDSNLSDIVLIFRTSFDGSKIRPHKENPNDPEYIAAKELDEMRQYEISLPGGVVGRQAIFSIVENVIRNAAKHGNWREYGKLELNMDIFTKEDVENNQPDNNLRHRLRDDDQADDNSLSLKDVLKRFYCDNNEFADDYYFITVTDNLNFTNTSLVSLRKALFEEYIDDEGRMINTNKGIKEMRISAAWLRSIDDDIALSPFNESNYKTEGEKSWKGSNYSRDKMLPPVLYARRSKNIATGAYNLQYIFCVRRPKKVVFISPSFDNLNKQQPDTVSHFHKHAWDLLSPDEYKTQKNKNYEFVIYDDTRLNETDLKKEEKRTNIYNKVRCISSKRFFNLSELPNEFTNLKSSILKISQSDDKHLIDLHKAYVLLYKFLSKWDKSEKILIRDDKARSLYENEKLLISKNDKKTANDKNNESKYNYENLVTSEKLTFIPTDENIKYRYITHLEEADQFKKYVINNKEQFDFSEGITGDNSTDRLVRNEAKTELWFYKHLHAMKQKVAIYDERIFAKVTGLDESDFISPESLWGMDLKSDKEYIKSKNIFSNEEIENIDKMFDTRELLEQFMAQKGISRPDVFVSDMKNVDAQNHLGATYYYKNLEVFSIIRSIEDPKRFNLYGIRINKDKPYFSECVRFATISWLPSKKQLIINNINNVNDENEERQSNRMKFHSLSIHQGLLDKLYSAFGIEKNDVEAKENLTKDFYKHFVINDSEHVIKFGQPSRQHYFLPGMTIHSGRSKPSKEDMPQLLPFIPYSAIEQAVLDCKYSIVELLDSARYE